MALNRLICGIVASPTPTMPISSDSTSSILRPVSPMILEIAAAAIHPAVPPPTITTFSMASGLTPSSRSRS